MVFVPPRFAADAIYESADAGIELVVCIAEGIPAHEMLDVYTYLRPRGIRLLGPNCPGALSPGAPTSGSSRRRCSPRAAWAWCRAPAR